MKTHVCPKCGGQPGQSAWQVRAHDYRCDKCRLADQRAKNKRRSVQKPHKRRPVVDRLWDNSMPVPHSGCWVYLGPTRCGYGIIAMPTGSRSKTVSAHRAAYEALVGPIPPGMTIDHKCRVRCCWNPAHLQVVTGAENTLLGTSPPALNARRDKCLNGHPFDYVDTEGRRQCSLCRQAYQRRYYYLKRARILLHRAEDMERIGPSYWWHLQQAASLFGLAGRSDLSERAVAMIEEKNWCVVPELLREVSP